MPTPAFHERTGEGGLSGVAAAVSGALGDGVELHAARTNATTEKRVIPPS